jgi:hypothetical protein
MRKTLCFLILLFCFIPVRGLADSHPEEMVRFEGIVRDAYGNDIDGAAITVRVVKSGQEIGHIQSKNEAFRWWYRQGESGPYELRVEASGFESRTLGWPLVNWPYVTLRAAKALP